MNWKQWFKKPALPKQCNTILTSRLSDISDAYVRLIENITAVSTTALGTTHPDNNVKRQ